MKKLIRVIISLIFIFVIFTSCKNNTNSTVIDNNGIEHIYIKNDIYDIYLYTIKFEYQNHNYIYFSYGHGISVIHDPDCSCNKND